MDTLDKELNTQEESKQIKKLQMYQKLVFFTLYKFKWSIITVFFADDRCRGCLPLFSV